MLKVDKWEREQREKLRQQIREHLAKNEPIPAQLKEHHFQLIMDMCKALDRKDIIEQLEAEREERKLLNAQQDHNAGSKILFFLLLAVFIAYLLIRYT